MAERSDAPLQDRWSRPWVPVGIRNTGAKDKDVPLQVLIGSTDHIPPGDIGHHVHIDTSVTG